MKTQTAGFRPNPAKYVWQSSAWMLNLCICDKYQNHMYSKTCVKWPPSKRPKIGFQDHLLLDAGKKYRAA